MPNIPYLPNLRSSQQEHLVLRGGTNPKPPGSPSAPSASGTQSLLKTLFRYGQATAKKATQRAQNGKKTGTMGGTTSSQSMEGVEQTMTTTTPTPDSEEMVTRLPRIGRA